MARPPELQLDECCISFNTVFNPLLILFFGHAVSTGVLLCFGQEEIQEVGFVPETPGRIPPCQLSADGWETSQKLTPISSGPQRV